MHAEGANKSGSSNYLPATDAYFSSRNQLLYDALQLRAIENKVVVSVHFNKVDIKMCVAGLNKCKSVNCSIFKQSIIHVLSKVQTVSRKLVRDFLTSKKGADTKRDSIICGT